MNRKGFTLVELMVVVAIVAILAAVAVPMYSKYRCRASWADVQGCMADIGMRLENYRSNRGRYPAGGSIWSDLGYTSGAPDCGDHYEGNVITTNSTYLVYFKDTKRPLSCTQSSSFDNDVWALVNTSSKVYHVYNTSNESEEPLPANFVIP